MDDSNKKIIWLIGEVSSCFPEGSPTIREVLRVYFYYRFVLLKQKDTSVKSIANNLIAHWRNLGLGTIADQDVVRKIEKVIEKYDLYKKSMHRDTPTQRCNERKLVSLLDERFDIAPKINYHNKKQKVEPKSVKCEIVQQSDLNSNITPDFDMYEVVDTDVNKSNDSDFEMTLSKYQKSKFSSGSMIKLPGVIQKIIDSPDVSSALDRTNISAPKFTILCAAIAGAVGENLNECVLSTSTCYRRRQIHRDQIVTIIKDDFMSSSKPPLVLHWDGKKLRDTTNDNLALRKKKVERLAVVVSGVDVQKIITIAKIKDGTGLVISDTVYEHVVEWNLLDEIVAVCTDTTASNTGIFNGSVVLFQQLMERNILYFACRHHVLELIVGAVYEVLFGESTGPS